MVLEQLIESLPCVGDDLGGVIVRISKIYAGEPVMMALKEFVSSTQIAFTARILFGAKLLITAVELMVREALF